MSAMTPIMKRNLCLALMGLGVILVLQYVVVRMHNKIAGEGGEIEKGCSTLVQCLNRAWENPSSVSLKMSPVSQPVALAGGSEDSVGSVQELLMLQAGAIAIFMSNLFAALLQLLEIGLVLFATCTSMTMVAQEKADRRPNVPAQKLFTVGTFFGAVVSLCFGWHWLTIPFFGILAGVANIYFPYTFYITEIQKNPEEAEPELDIPGGTEPLSLSPAMRLHVLGGLCVSLFLVFLNYVSSAERQEIFLAATEEMEGYGSWLNNIVNIINPSEEQITSDVQNTSDVGAALDGHVQYFLQALNRPSETGGERFFNGVVDAVKLLINMGWIALLACVSMATVAYRKPHNFSYRTRLFVYGLGWGAVFALLNEWSLLYTPFFAVLAGIVNSNFPYTVYVTEITRYTDWAYRV